MTNDAHDPPAVDVPRSLLLHGQLRHLLLLFCILLAAEVVAGRTLATGSFLRLSTNTWFWIALAVPMLQQWGVVIVWRTQLCFRFWTRLFGKAGFYLWGATFMPLLVARPLTTLAVGLADAGSLRIAPAPAYGLGGALLLPALYTLYSVHRYFGIPRALGGDHFYERYRALPMVREGAFKYSSNAMYSFAFLALWAIALFCLSRAALAVALFQHTYIWVHWYCTEQPDGVVLYGRSQDEV